MIKLLIVDDSKTETELLMHILGSEKDMQIVGCAKNGKEAILLTKKLKPDLITMDIQMPEMNGLEATRLIMMDNPTPIIVISSVLHDKQLDMTFLALEAGALGVLDKPANILDPNFKYVRKKMVDYIRGMAEIQVVRKRYPPMHGKAPTPIEFKSSHSNYDILGIGASIGGPQALKTILSQLPSDFPIPIVIVQHMTVGFIQGFCDWMDNCCELTVKCAEDGERLKSGHVYFAPENRHLRINRHGGYLYAELQHGEPVAGFCPSITVLFDSIAHACGESALGLLLTGMGREGAQGLLELHKKHAHTMIQDKKSCVVFGMASVAESLGAVDKVVELDLMVDYLCKITYLA